MKKILLTTILSVFYFTSASAELGVNVGLSGQMGLFAASAQESHTDTTSSSSTTFKSSDTEVAAVGYSSIFLEKTLGDRLAIGVDYVMNGLSSDTVESTKTDLTGTGSAASTSKTNTVQIDFEDLTTIYLAFNINENIYVKAGAVTVDVITNETLGTGSSYGNTSLDGTTLGVGYNKTFDNTMFVRVEGNYMELDGASISANDNKITLDGIDGVTGKVSVGKSF
jgi:hypothetical protein